QPDNATTQIAPVSAHHPINRALETRFTTGPVFANRQTQNRRPRIPSLSTHNVKQQTAFNRRRQDDLDPIRALATLQIKRAVQILHKPAEAGRVAFRRQNRSPFPVARPSGHM
ncbi:MAG TPA: hypothetical protein VGJ31_04915, partial [Dongiaceae bacterium]